MLTLQRPCFKPTTFTISCVLCCIFLSGFSSPVFGQDSFALIVNQRNAFTDSREDMISLITRLYLKKGKMWPDTELTCRPFDRDANSPEHQYFVEKILQMSEGRLSEHWAKMKQLRGDTPPRKIKSTRILLKLIQKNEGAFGIVNRDDIGTLPEHIKVLFVF